MAVRPRATPDTGCVTTVVPTLEKPPMPADWLQAEYLSGFFVDASASTHLCYWLAKPPLRAYKSAQSRPDRHYSKHLYIHNPLPPATIFNIDLLPGMNHMKKLMILMAPIMAAALLAGFATTASAQVNIWDADLSGNAGDWTNAPLASDWSNPTFPTVGAGQDLFIASGSLRATSNNTWIDDGILVGIPPGTNPSPVKWGGKTMTLSGTGAIQHWGGKQIRIGEGGTGLLTQTGGTHFLTASGANGNVQLRIGSNNNGGNGTYDLSGGLLTNSGVAPGFTATTGNGNVLVGNGGTGTLTVSGLAVIDLTAPTTSGAAALVLTGTNQRPGSSRLNVIGSGASIDLHSLSLSGANAGESSIHFDFNGASDVSTIDVLGIFADTAASQSVLVTQADILLSNFGAIATNTTIDLIDAAFGFDLQGPGFTLDATSVSAGWGLGIVNGVGSQQILQASFVPEPGSALALCFVSIFAAGRRRRRS